jgi:hypothetical protein
VKRLTMVTSAIALVGAWQFASAQPPGGGGGFTPPTFDAINMADDQGKKDDHLTVDEVRAYFEKAFAGRGGPPGGGGGGGGGDFAANIFGNWDANHDGMVTQKEFDERPQGRGRGGPPPQ